MEIKDILKKLHENQDEIYSILCSVVEVDEGQRTIHAKPLNGSAEIFDVRLQTMLSGVIGIVNFPKVGSDVIVNFISKEVAYVALNSEIEKIQLNIGDMSFFVDATNANLDVENTSIISENIDVASENINVGATATKFNSNTFEVDGQSFKITGTLAEIIATAIKLTGAVTITGTTTIAGAVAVAGSVALNGGANGGVPKSGSLVAEINKIKQDFQDLKAKFTAWTPVNNDGGANLKTKLNSWSPNVTPIADADISNPQNTH
jgi:phage baseplate assembly protein gpV